VTDEELRELQERVVAIQDLAAHPGWTYALDRIIHQISIYQNRLIMGKATDHTEYREWVAYTDGLSFVLKLREHTQEELDRELSAREEAEVYG
jgi:hypothetical protein